jgi:hypothetical protein
LSITTRIVVIGDRGNRYDSPWSPLTSTMAALHHVMELGALLLDASIYLVVWLFFGIVPLAGLILMTRRLIRLAVLRVPKRRSGNSINNIPAGRGPASVVPTLPLTTTTPKNKSAFDEAENS